MKTISKRDSQKSRCYAAENNALKCLAGSIKCYNRVDDIQNDIYNFMYSEKFKSEFVPLDVVVTDGRRRRSACCCFRGTKKDKWFVIKLPKMHRNALTVMHELAHAFSYFQPWHGAQFCSVYLKLVKLYMGEYAAGILEENFKAFKVRYTI